MDKFLLADNPMRPEQSSLFINHMVNPIAIIRCTEGHEKADSIFKHYQFRNSDGIIEEWTLSVFHLFTTDFLTEPEQQAVPVLDRAWRWFRAYLKNEDNNIDLKGYGEEN